MTFKTAFETMYSLMKQGVRSKITKINKDVYIVSVVDGELIYKI